MPGISRLALSGSGMSACRRFRFWIANLALLLAACTGEAVVVPGTVADGAKALVDAGTVDAAVADAVIAAEFGADAAADDATVEVVDSTDLTVTEVGDAGGFAAEADADELGGADASEPSTADTAEPSTADANGAEAESSDLADDSDAVAGGGDLGDTDAPVAADASDTPATDDDTGQGDSGEPVDAQEIADAAEGNDGPTYDAPGLTDAAAVDVIAEVAGDGAAADLPVACTLDAVGWQGLIQRCWWASRRRARRWASSRA